MTPSPVCWLLALPEVSDLTGWGLSGLDGPEHFLRPRGGVSLSQEGPRPLPLRLLLGEQQAGGRAWAACLGALLKVRDSGEQKPLRGAGPRFPPDPGAAQDLRNVTRGL